jgi:nicotinic acid mononucleotide adenylyltransferase
MNQNIVCVYGGNFWPPGRHHRLIAESLSKLCDTLVIFPSGNRTDRSNASGFNPTHKRELVKLNFSNIPGSVLDFTDLSHPNFTPTYLIDQRMKVLFPNAQIRHAVGTDLITGGSKGQSQIQTRWINGHQIWNELNFDVVISQGQSFNLLDLPPRFRIVSTQILSGRSTLIRELLENSSPEAKNHLLPEVYDYIVTSGLFHS